uniref:Large ribosomal subunit protein uL4m n=1 Tax=Aegilops tauschii subsp. strangulata TaxID=200361 RepID=A0A453N2P5_AEGTS
QPNLAGAGRRGRGQPMQALTRAASLLRRAVACPPQLGAAGRDTPLLAKILPNVYSNGYSTLMAPANEVLIPPELLSSKTVWTPDRELGQYEDLVARVTNFHNEDKGFMVLDGDVFDVPIRKDIVHRVVRWQLAKRQQGTHSTKTISEVSGTGRKPYKQKGTGRARHGTLRGCQVILTFLHSYKLYQIGSGDISSSLGFN